MSAKWDNNIRDQLRGGRLSTDFGAKEAYWSKPMTILDSPYNSMQPTNMDIIAITQTSPCNSMDNQSQLLTRGRVSFANDHLMPSPKVMEMMKTLSAPQEMKQYLNQKKSSINFLGFPISDATESATWRKPPIDLYQLLPLSLSGSTEQLVNFSEGKDGPSKHDKNQDHNEDGSRDSALRGVPQLGDYTINHIGREKVLWLENTRNWLSTNGYLRSLFEKSDLSHERGMSMHYLREWLRGSSIKALIKDYKQKRKDQIRIQRAQVHAALSIAEVATAIAGFAANSENSSDPALASAASLVAAVCAKAAESMGADRTHVSLIINAAATSNSPNDILKLTCLAEKCLRCTATQSRVDTNKEDYATPIFTPHIDRDNKDNYGRSNSLIDEAALAKGAELIVRSHDGKKAQKRKVHISLEGKLAVLRLIKKCFGGALRTSKQYYIIDVPQQVEEKNLYLLEWKTTEPSTTQIMFRDRKQRDTWGTTITYLLIKKASATQ